MELPKNPALRYGIIAQAFLYAGFAVCIALKPGGLFVNDGMSYYGAQQITIIPYTISLALTAWFLWRCARELPQTISPMFQYFLMIISAAITVLILTPYKQSETFHSIHVFTGTTLFLFQYLVMLWLVFVSKQKTVPIVMFIAITVISLFTGFYLYSIDGYLILGQLLFQLLFGITSYRYVKQAS